MAQKDKVCIKLAFNEATSESRSMKVKDFWNYMNDAKPLQPHKATPSAPATKEKDNEPPKYKRMWYNNLKVFKKHGLDKIALAAAKQCTLCSQQMDCKVSEFAERQEESYAELVEDMKAFDEKLNAKSNTN